MPRNNLIPFPFPASPPFARPRKRGARSHADLQASITSNLPLLMEKSYKRIKDLWRRQVPMAWIAKMEQLTIAQVEACLWVAYNAGEILTANELSSQDFAVVAARTERAA